MTRAMRVFLLVTLCFFALAFFFYSGHTHLTDEDITIATARQLLPHHQTYAPPDPVNAISYHYGLLPLAGTIVTIILSSHKVAGYLILPAILLPVFSLLYLAGLPVRYFFYGKPTAAGVVIPAKAIIWKILILLFSAVIPCVCLILLEAHGKLPLHLLLFGITAACCHYLAQRAGLSSRRALVVVLLACAASSLLVWSEFIKDEIYGVAALTGALAATAAARPRLAASCLALMVLAKPALLVAALPLAFAARGRRAIGIALLALIAAVALVAADNFRRFGMFTGGYQSLLPTSQPQNFSFPVWLGLTGHLFSPLRSIFLYNPFLLLVLPVAVTRLRRRSITRLELCAAAGALAYLLLISAWTGWEGEVGYANRLALPSIMLGVIFLPGAVKTTSRSALLLVLILGFFINLPGVAWDFANYYQLPEHQRELVFAIRPQPLSSAAFRQTGEMFTLGYRALLTGFPRLLTDNPFTSASDARLMIEYHSWLAKPDLWPVYVLSVADSFGSPARLPPDTAERQHLVLLLLLPWLASGVLFMLLLCHLWRLPQPKS